MVNPFVICSVEEQAVLREYADQERWLSDCQRLNASLAALHVYNASALRYAATTIYPNHLVVAHARRLAKEALMRGETLPTNAEQAIDDENRRRWRELLNR